MKPENESLNLRFEVTNLKKLDEKGCKCFMPCVKDGWIDGIKSFHRQARVK